MEGPTKQLIELDKLELLNRATAYHKSVAKGAEVLYKNDVNGEVFLTITNEELKELGIKSFGVRKSLMKFRENVIKLEATFNHHSRTTPNGPVKKVKNNLLLEPSPDNSVSEAWTGEKKEDLDAEISEMDYQPGASIHGELSVDSSEDIYQKPRPTPRLKNQCGGNDVLAGCRSRRTEVPNVIEKQMPRVGYKYSKKFKSYNDTDFSRLGAGNESISEVHLVNEKKKPRVEHLNPKKKRNISKNEISPRLDAFDDDSSNEQSVVVLDSHASDYKSTCSFRSMVSIRSMTGKKKLKDWIINEKVTWEENGKRKSADTFTELRTENEVLLEGFVQKLTGVNSKWMVNHWTSRYAVLLKSRVFLLFHYDRKTLYQKSSTDLRMVGKIGVPQTDIAAGTLKFEILLTTRKRIVLGFKTESKLLMWRNDIISLVKDMEIIEC